MNEKLKLFIIFLIKNKSNIKLLNHKINFFFTKLTNYQIQIKRR